jgi:hypothetical protein
MEALILWLGFSIAIGILASRRGRSGIGWFLFSLILSPLLGLIFVLVLPRRNLQFEDVSPETHSRCPDCKELVRKDARKCRHCGCSLMPTMQ